MTRPTSKNINGDCLKIMPTMKEKSIGFVLADLPYEQTAADWDSMIDLKAMWKELKRIVKPNSAICLFASQPFTSILTCSNLENFKHEYIWWKNRTSNFLNAKIQPLKAHESILVFSFGKCPYYPQKSQGHTPVNFARRKANSSTTYGLHKEAVNEAGNTDRYPTTILMFNSVDNCSRERFHQNQKPVDLLQYLIRTYSKPTDTVLDITAGSFSTGVACVFEKRKFIGIETIPTYCGVGKERIKHAQGLPADLRRKLLNEKPMPLFAIEQAEL